MVKGAVVLKSWCGWHAIYAYLAGVQRKQVTTRPKWQWKEVHIKTHC